MPRGLAVLYSTQEKIRLFNMLKEELKKRQFNIKHPNSGRIQVCNESGVLVKINEEEVHYFVNDENAVVSFWNNSLDSVTVATQGGDSTLNSCIIYIDGLSGQVSFEVFLALTAALENAETKGFIFDRREMTEGINWGSIFTNSTCADEFIQQAGFTIASEARVALGKAIDYYAFQIDSAYVALKTVDGVFRIIELG